MPKFDATAWADAIQSDRLAYAFGSGHSRFIAGELYWRAGGLAPVMIIDDPAHGAAECLEGYAELIYKRYTVQAGDLFFVISNSGINPVPIEMAQLAKTSGALVIAVTNLEQSAQATSRHSTGKRLFEIADHILDTMGPYGDATVPLTVEASTWHVAPLSTLLSVAMLNAVVAQTAYLLAERGMRPPILISANVPEGDTHNQELCERYWNRLAEFPRRLP